MRNVAYHNGYHAHHRLMNTSLRSYCFVFLVLVILGSARTTAQDQSGPIKQSRKSMIGVWKIIHPDEIVDSTHIPFTLLFLQADSSFVWGVDSTKKDPMANTLTGRWKQTALGELKLMIGPDLSTGIVGYYQRLSDKQYRLFNKVDDSTKDELVQTNDTILDKVGEIREEPSKE